MKDTKTTMHIPDSLAHTSKVFAALGDDIRQQILLLFASGESMNIKQITEAINLSRTAVVHHIKVLEESGILRGEKSGSSVLYNVDTDVVLTALGRLEEYVRNCLEQYYKKEKI